MRHITAVALLVLSGVAHSEWTKQDSAWQLAYTALHVADWAQTRNIARNPDEFHETNPILGRHPSVSEVDDYFLVTGVAHALVSAALPPKYRRKWQAAGIVVEAGAVAHNYSIGISMSW